MRAGGARGGHAGGQSSWRPGVRRPFGPLPGSPDLAAVRASVLRGESAPPVGRERRGRRASGWGWWRERIISSYNQTAWTYKLLDLNHLTYKSSDLWKSNMA